MIKKKEEKLDSEKKQRKFLKQQKELYETTSSKKYIKILETIHLKFTENPNAIADNLLSVLKNQDFLFNCYENLKSNKGSLTKGTDETTADQISIERIHNLSTALENGSFLFKPSRRVEIPKPGKTKKRPLTIPNFDDRIIQEGIRLILNSIFEPIFSKIQVNFGFRPKLNTIDAMKHTVTANIKSATTAIEGDIEGAYDNVNPQIMLHILSEKIKDKKFLNIIKQGFEAGIFIKDIYENTTLGIPQGGIASPILFNIYMHKFDQYITTEIHELINKKNILEQRQDQPSINYRKLSKKRMNIIDKMKRTLKKNNPSKKYQNMILINKYRQLQKQNKHMRKLLRKLPSKAMNKSKLYIRYTRYADDWIILTNCNSEYGETLKQNIKIWLKENLKLNLSEEKTKVTDIQKEPALFLGFRIKNNQKHTYITTYKKTIGNKELLIKQRASRELFVDIDHNRLTQRLYYKQIIDNTTKPGPTHKSLYIVLKEQEIIQRYKAHLEGLFQYYWIPLTNKSTLSRYHYYIYYSCLKTLAARRKTTLRNIIQTFGKNLSYTWEEKYTNKKQEINITKRKTFIPTYIQLMKQTKRRMETSRSKVLNNDFLTIHINLRTAYKTTKYCCICGTQPTNSNPIESHHIKSIRKIGQTNKGFSLIMRQLNSKQIVICKTCHHKIHDGKYDNMKLSEFFDPIMAENF
jgi:group II intron reverse transcriptase/maturase